MPCRDPRVVADGTIGRARRHRELVFVVVIHLSRQNDGRGQLDVVVGLLRPAGVRPVVAPDRVVGGVRSLGTDTESRLVARARLQLQLGVELGRSRTEDRIGAIFAGDADLVRVVIRIECGRRRGGL